MNPEAISILEVISPFFCFLLSIYFIYGVWKEFFPDFKNPIEVGGTLVLSAVAIIIAFAITVVFTFTSLWVYTTIFNLFT